MSAADVNGARARKCKSNESNIRRPANAVHSLAWLIVGEAEVAAIHRHEHR